MESCFARPHVGNDMFARKHESYISHTAMSLDQAKHELNVDTNY